MIDDALILEGRMSAMRDVPWPLPALVLIQFSDEDLDRLESAEEEEYWKTLNAIVARIQRDER